MPTKMFAAFAAGGDTAEAAFFDTVEALNSMDDPSPATRPAWPCSAHKFEDLEAGVLPVLASIETAAYDGAAALQQINDVKYNDLGSAFEAIKRSAEVSLLPMASMIANTLTALAPILPGDLRGHRPRHHGNAQRLYAVCAAVPHGIGQALQQPCSPWSRNWPPGCFRCSRS